MEDLLGDDSSFDFSDDSQLSVGEEIKSTALGAKPQITGEHVGLQSHDNQNNERATSQHVHPNTQAQQSNQNSEIVKKVAIEDTNDDVSSLQDSEMSDLLAEMGVDDSSTNYTLASRQQANGTQMDTQQQSQQIDSFQKDQSNNSEQQLSLVYAQGQNSGKANVQNPGHDEPQTSVLTRPEQNIRDVKQQNGSQTVATDVQQGTVKIMESDDSDREDFSEDDEISLLDEQSNTNVQQQQQRFDHIDQQPTGQNIVLQRQQSEQRFSRHASEKANSAEDIHSNQEEENYEYDDEEYDDDQFETNDGGQSVHGSDPGQEDLLPSILQSQGIDNDQKQDQKYDNRKNQESFQLLEQLNLVYNEEEAAQIATKLSSILVSNNSSVEFETELLQQNFTNIMTNKIECSGLPELTRECFGCLASISIKSDSAKADLASKNVISLAVKWLQVKRSFINIAAATLLYNMSCTRNQVVLEKFSDTSVIQQMSNSLITRHQQLQITLLSVLRNLSVTSVRQSLHDMSLLKGLSQVLVQPSQHQQAGDRGFDMTPAFAVVIQTIVGLSYNSVIAQQKMIQVGILNNLAQAVRAGNSIEARAYAWVAAANLVWGNTVGQTKSIELGFIPHAAQFTNDAPFHYKGQGVYFLWSMCIRNPKTVQAVSQSGIIARLVNEAHTQIDQQNSDQQKSVVAQDIFYQYMLLLFRQCSSTVSGRTALRADSCVELLTYFTKLSIHEIVNGRSSQMYFPIIDLWTSLTQSAEGEAWIRLFYTNDLCKPLLEALSLSRKVSLENIQQMAGCLILIRNLQALPEVQSAFRAPGAARQLAKVLTLCMQKLSQMPISVEVQQNHTSENNFNNNDTQCLKNGLKKYIYQGRVSHSQFGDWFSSNFSMECLSPKTTKNKSSQNWGNSDMFNGLDLRPFQLQASSVGNSGDDEHSKMQWYDACVKCCIGCIAGIRVACNSSASESSKVKQDCFNNDCVVHIGHILSDQNCIKWPVEAKLEACKLAQILADSEASVVDMVSQDIVPSLIHPIEYIHSSKKLEGQIFQGLWKLAYYSEGAAKQISAQLPMINLEQPLYERDQETLMPVLGLISALTKSQDYFSVEFSQPDTVVQLYHILKISRQQIDKQITVLSILANIARQQSVCTLMGTSGAISVVKEVLCSSYDSGPFGLVLSAAQALGNLSINNYGNQTLVGQEECIDTLLQVIARRRSSPDHVVALFQAMCNVIHDHRNNQILTVTSCHFNKAAQFTQSNELSVRLAALNFVHLTVDGAQDAAKCCADKGIGQKLMKCCRSTVSSEQKLALNIISQILCFSKEGLTAFDAAFLGEQYIGMAQCGDKQTVQAGVQGLVAVLKIKKEIVAQKLAKSEQFSGIVQNCVDDDNVDITKQKLKLIQLLLEVEDTRTALLPYLQDTFSQLEKQLQSSSINDKSLLVSLMQCGMCVIKAAPKPIATSMVLQFRLHLVTISRSLTDGIDSETVTTVLQSMVQLCQDDTFGSLQYFREVGTLDYIGTVLSADISDDATCAALTLLQVFSVDEKAASEVLESGIVHMVVGIVGPHSQSGQITGPSLGESPSDGASGHAPVHGKDQQIVNTNVLIAAIKALSQLCVSCADISIFVGQQEVVKQLYMYLRQCVKAVGVEVGSGRSLLISSINCMLNMSLQHINQLHILRLKGLMQIVCKVFATGDAVLCEQMAQVLRSISCYSRKAQQYVGGNIEVIKFLIKFTQTGSQPVRRACIATLSNAAYDVQEVQLQLTKCGIFNLIGALLQSTCMDNDISVTQLLQSLMIGNEEIKMQSLKHGIIRQVIVLACSNQLQQKPTVLVALWQVLCIAATGCPQIQNELLGIGSKQSLLIESEISTMGRKVLSEAEYFKENYALVQLQVLKLYLSLSRQSVARKLIKSQSNKQIFGQLLKHSDPQVVQAAKKLYNF